MSAHNQRWDDNMMVMGFLIGVLVGGIITLLRLPRTGKEMRQALFKQGAELRQQIEATDTVEQSLREGKAAAQRQQSQK